MSAFHPKQTLVPAPNSVSHSYRKPRDSCFSAAILPFESNAKLRKTALVSAIALQRSGVRFPSAPPAPAISRLRLESNLFPLGRIIRTAESSFKS